MDAGGIQRLLSSVNAHEACTLLESFRSEFRHFQQLFPALELPVLPPGKSRYSFAMTFVTPDIYSSSGADAVIQIDATRFTVLHDTAKRLAQFFLIHIVLILTDTRSPLDRSFTSSASGSCTLLCYGRCASLTHVKIPEFFCRQFAGGIYGSTCLIRDDILNLPGISFRSSTINCSDSLDAVPLPTENQRHAILANHLLIPLWQLSAFPFVVGAVDR